MSSWTKEKLLFSIPIKSRLGGKLWSCILLFAESVCCPVKDKCVLKEVSWKEMKPELTTYILGGHYVQGCLVQVGHGIELDTVGRQFEPYLWFDCGVTWDSSRTVVVIKLLRTSAFTGNCQQVRTTYYT